MGIKPTHKVTCVSGETQEPGGTFECEVCGIMFNVDPCTEDNCVRVEAGLESCCPQDPARGDNDREFWIVDGDSMTRYLALKPGPIDFFEYQKELIECFSYKGERCSHSHDCCGCWFQTGTVKKMEKDGWTIYSKSFNKNV